MFDKAFPIFPQSVEDKHRALLATASPGSVRLYVIEDWGNYHLGLYADDHRMRAYCDTAWVFGAAGHVPKDVHCRLDRLYDSVLRAVLG